MKETEGWIACETCGMAVSRIDRELEGHIYHNTLVPINEKAYCLGEPVRRVHVEPDLSIVCPKVNHGG